MLAAAWTIHTEVFEGPLDLLLYLVRRDGVDIRTVPMAHVADAYFAYLEQMRELNLSLASDYLVMAATLTHLKSLEILPRLPTLIEEEDQEDPRETLAKQLLEYERFKLAAESLDQHVIEDSGADVISCCRDVLRQLGGVGGEADLRDMIAMLPRADQRVVTFIGVLEMARLQWVSVHQAEHLGRVSVVALVEPDVDLSQVTGEVAQEAAG